MWNDRHFQIFAELIWAQAIVGVLCCGMLRFSPRLAVAEAANHPASIHSPLLLLLEGSGFREHFPCSTSQLDVAIWVYSGQ